MKWNVYIYNPKTGEAETKVLEYAKTTSADGAAVTQYAARESPEAREVHPRAPYGPRSAPWAGSWSEPLKAPTPTT